MNAYSFKKNSPGAPICLLAALIILFPSFLHAQIQSPDGGEKSGSSPVSDQALSGAMAMINDQKFGEAKKTLKEAIQKDPLNELLWLSYDSCVRSEMLANNPAEIRSTDTAKAAGAADARNTIKNGETVDDGAEIIKTQPAQIVSGANLLPADKALTPKTNENEEDIDCAILDADFSGGAASGDLACLLNDTFKFINAGGGFYLSARAKDKNATVSFSFNISKFPKKVKLQIAHRLVKKDRFLSAASLTIDLNEHKVNYDSIKLGNKLETSEYDITNMSKIGANILTLNVENSAYPYLLKNVKVLLYFKD
jgi:hypothetical protein